MVEFRTATSRTRGVRIVEVWDGPDFVATITPQETGAALRIVSKHELDYDYVPAGGTNVLGVKFKIAGRN